MSERKYEEVSVTTIADGSATVRSLVYFTGRLSFIDYVKTDFADGSVLLITSDKTGQTLWSETAVNASEKIAPRQPTHDNVGAASKFDTTDNEPVEDHYILQDERVKIVLTGGGDTKSGVFKILCD